MLLSSLSENLITLLVYDAQHAPIIRNMVGVEMYGGIYRELVTRVYDYLDQFGKPPGDHLADLLEDKIGSDSREAQMYAGMVQACHDSYPGINAEYVMSKLETQIKRQSLRGIAVDLVKALQKDTEESLEEAERLISSSTKQTLKVFDPGICLGDTEAALAFLDKRDQAFPMGIAELDKRGFGPARKQLWLYIGNTKSGKTWMLTHLAKMAVLQRLKVCHITLELSADLTSRRYQQCLFGVANRSEPTPITKFTYDAHGHLTGVDRKQVMPQLAFDDPDIKAKLKRKLTYWGKRGLNNVFIKEFPTGSLTTNQLSAYLDMMETQNNFTPDLLIIDYPDLFKLKSDNIRIELDRVYVELRGLAVARNCAVAVVSQSHRKAANAQIVRGDNVTEAYSKLAHADTVITYSATEAEKKLKLARLLVTAGRNDEDNITVVISQNYATGSYAIDSALLNRTYWGLVEVNEETD